MKNGSKFNVKYIVGRYKVAFTILTAIAGFTLFMQSCVKKVVDLNELGSEQWQPNLAAPLVSSSLTIDDIITKYGTDGSVLIGSDKSVTVVYQGNLFSFYARDLFKIPAQSYTQTIQLNNTQLATLIGSGSVTLNYTQTANFNSGPLGPQVDSIIYKSGLLTDSIVSNFGHSAIITITIPTAKKNGTVFTQSLNINYTGTTPVIAMDVIDLSGYKFDMTANGTATNQFDINYSVKINYNSANTPTTANTITIIQKFANPLFDKIYGYIGQQSLIPANKDIDTVSLGLFKNSIAGSTITLNNPKVKFIFYNSFGVPINANMSNLVGFTPPSSIYPLTGTGIPSPLPVKSPTTLEVGQTKVDSFSIDKTNSNIVSLINNLPQNIAYKLSAQTNPLGKVSQNFIIDSSLFKVNMEVQIPLDGSATTLTIMDTIKDFKLNLTDSIVSIKSLLLRTYVSNGFPTDVAIQVYVTDTLYNVIDSSISPFQVLMPSAIVNSTTGKVISPSIKTTDSNFDKLKINNISKARRALIKGVIATTNNGSTPVKIYSDYKLAVKIGIQGVLNVKIGK